MQFGLQLQQLQKTNLFIAVGRLTGSVRLLRTLVYDLGGSELCTFTRPL